MATIKKLIKKKKFKKFLILGNLPISIDGFHKLSRDGELPSVDCLERQVKSTDGKITQQYIAILEANITLQNGLTIPLPAQSIYTL